MSRQPATPALESPARRFGREITDAIGAGAVADDMVLRLTLMDSSKVKRDPDLPLDDISFSADGMRFLGVRVVEGGVRASTLVIGEPVDAPAPAPAKPAGRSRKPKAAS